MGRRIGERIMILDKQKKFEEVYNIVNFEFKDTFSYASKYGKISSLIKFLIDKEIIPAYYPEPIIHLKTGNPYYYLNDIINTTNENDGQTMALYLKNNSIIISDMLAFARKKSEFTSKFRPIDITRVERDEYDI